MQKERLRRRLMLSPRGRHISAFKSLKEFVGAFIDIVETHEALWNARIPHRDISIKNVMLAPSENLKEKERSRGLLIDFDYAKCGSDDDDSEIAQANPNGRAGSPSFMSIKLLVGNGTTEHSEKHDLESLLYVLLYVCTKYESPGKRNDGDYRHPDHPFGRQLEKQTDLYNIGCMRNLQICFLDLTKEMFKHVHLYFTPLIPLLENFCNTVFQLREEQRVFIPNGTHAKVLRILNEAFNELPGQDDISGCPEKEKPDAEGLPTVTVEATDGHPPQDIEVVGESRAGETGESVQ